jgi:ATP-dependent RNA helicase RhlE
MINENTDADTEDLSDFSKADASAFAVLGVSVRLTDWLGDQGYSIPTPIQVKSIPPMLSGQDVVGIAPTGTGKTLAYLLPTIQKLGYASEQYPRLLIMAPSRELTEQIHKVAAAIAAPLELRAALLVGGLSIVNQRKELGTGTDIIVATPGRLMEHYSDGHLRLSNARHIILDEADRLMDMGFMPQLRNLLEILPRKKQYALFSATFSGRVEELSEEFLEWPVRVEAASVATIPVNIQQLFYKVPNMATKQLILLELLRQDPHTTAFIFARKRETATQLATLLEGERYNVVAIHGNKTQNGRMAALNAYREGTANILIATDVAARGLDIVTTQIVINYDLPLEASEYIHRIGRAGRAGRDGTAYTFVNPLDEGHMHKLQKLLGRQTTYEPIPFGITPVATPFSEEQEYARGLDELRKKADPTYQGAFHVKIRPAPAVKEKPADKRLAKKKRTNTKRRR